VSKEKFFKAAKKALENPGNPPKKVVWKNFGEILDKYRGVGYTVFSEVEQLPEQS